MSWRRVSVCPCRSSCIFYFFIFRFVYHVSAVSARRIMHLVHLSMLDALWKFELPSSSVPPPPTSSPSSTATRAMHRKRFFEWSEEIKKRNSADRQTHLAYAGDRQLLCREPHCIFHFVSLFFIIILFIIILPSNPYTYTFESCALKSQPQQASAHRKLHDLSTCVFSGSLVLHATAWAEQRERCDKCM